MGVAVYKAGDGYHAGAVNDGGRLAFRRGAGDGFDFTVLDGDKGTKEHVHFGIHGHNGDVGN